MPAAMLDSPQSAEDLYLARGDEVSLARPLMTGDVFADVEIPGLDDGAGIGMITMHPCTMRRGKSLRRRVTVARVVTRAPIPLEKWVDGFFPFMPLPELMGSGQTSPFYAADLVDAGPVSTDALVRESRIACLSESGVELLQQRRAHMETRLAARLTSIHRMLAGPLLEAELAEDWAEAAMLASDDPKVDDAVAAEAAFQDWLDEVAGRRDMLRSSRSWAKLRREARKAAADRYPE